MVIDNLCLGSPFMNMGARFMADNFASRSFRWLLACYAPTRAVVRAIVVDDK